VIFRETVLQGAFVVELERIEDERGFFARTFCRREVPRARPDCGGVVQANTSFNRRKRHASRHALPGRPPEEAKLVRCTRGAVYDVIVDLRPGSPTFRSWVSVELTAGNDTMLFVPQGFAHGYQTLEDDTETCVPDNGVLRAERGPGRALGRPGLGSSGPRSRSGRSTSATATGPISTDGRSA
jgi:dTDP-4-dehydrorhamnose 3,5-epimerase